MKNHTKRFYLKDVKCEWCGKIQSHNTNMAYYINCSDCHRPKDIRDLTGVKRLDFS